MQISHTPTPLKCIMNGELENWENITCKVGLHYIIFNQ